jgi:hypothetical protein
MQIYRFEGSAVFCRKVFAEYTKENCKMLLPCKKVKIGLLAV